MFFFLGNITPIRRSGANLNSKAISGAENNKLSKIQTNDKQMQRQKMEIIVSRQGQHELDIKGKGREMALSQTYHSAQNDQVDATDEATDPILLMLPCYKLAKKAYFAGQIKTKIANNYFLLCYSRFFVQQLLPKQRISCLFSQTCKIPIYELDSVCPSVVYRCICVCVCE